MGNNNFPFGNYRFGKPSLYDIPRLCEADANGFMPEEQQSLVDNGNGFMPTPQQLYKGDLTHPSIYVAHSPQVEVNFSEKFTDF